MTGNSLKLSLLCVLAATIAGCNGQPEPAKEAKTESVDTKPLQRSEHPLTSLPAGGNCALDAVNGVPLSQVQVVSGADVVFSGWVGNVSGQVPENAELVLAEAQAQHAVMVSPDVARPDVAQALGQPGLADAGFNIQTNLAIEPGTYAMFMVLGGEQPTVCSLEAELKVN